MIRWWKRRRRPVPSGDWCRECLVDLPVGKVYEVRVGHEADDQGGGTFMAATYCRRHAPKAARRV